MPVDSVVGSVAGLWRFPVKSMQGERISDGEFTSRGLAGDRAYALIEADTAKVVSAKSVRLYPELLSCHAAYVEIPTPDGELPPVRITMGNGSSVTSDSGNVDNVLSAYFGRDVNLARLAPDNFTIDQYHPDVENADPAGYRDTIVEQKLGSAYFIEANEPSPVPVGAFFDLFPVSVMTTSTLDKLNELQPESTFDERRFRMNVIVATGETGFVENNWVDCDLALGEALRLHVAMPDPRCVMTTLGQDDLPRDTEVLRTLVRHNRIQVGDGGMFPCAGAYAVVQVAGTVQTGDPVSLI